VGGTGGDDDWYGYCLDDPVNGFDPLGLWVQFAPQINQVGIAVANEFMDGRPGVVEFSKRLGPHAWDAIKSYPDVVFENTEDEREFLAARATRYRERREEDQLRAKENAKEEEEAAAKADAISL